MRSYSYLRAFRSAPLCQKAARLLAEWINKPSWQSRPDLPRFGAFRVRAAVQSAVLAGEEQRGSRVRKEFRTTVCVEGKCMDGRFGFRRKVASALRGPGKDAHPYGMQPVL